MRREFTMPAPPEPPRGIVVQFPPPKKKRGRPRKPQPQPTPEPPSQPEPPKAAVDRGVYESCLLGVGVTPGNPPIEGMLDLARHLVPNHKTTVYAGVTTDAMLPTLRAGDILVADQSLECADGDLVLASVPSGIAARRLRVRDGGQWVMTDGGRAAPMKVDGDFQHGATVWAKVTFIVRAARPEGAAR